MNDYAAAAPKKDNQKMFYILLTFALLGSWGYIFYDQAQSKKYRPIFKLRSLRSIVQKRSCKKNMMRPSSVWMS